MPGPASAGGRARDVAVALRWPTTRRAGFDVAVDSRGLRRGNAAESPSSGSSVSRCRSDFIATAPSRQTSATRQDAESPAPSCGSLRASPSADFAGTTGGPQRPDGAYGLANVAAGKQSFIAFLDGALLVRQRRAEGPRGGTTNWISPGRRGKTSQAASVAATARRAPRRQRYLLTASAAAPQGTDAFQVDAEGGHTASLPAGRSDAQGCSHFGGGRRRLASRQASRSIPPGGGAAASSSTTRPASRHGVLDRRLAFCRRTRTVHRIRQACIRRRKRTGGSIRVAARTMTCRTALPSAAVNGGRAGGLKSVQVGRLHGPVRPAASLAPPGERSRTRFTASIPGVTGCRASGGRHDSIATR